jgi:hypothetical protein
VSQVSHLARKTAKIKAGKLNSELRCLTHRHDCAMKRLEIADSTLTDLTQTQIQNLTIRINEIQKTKLAKTKARSRANKCLLSESTNKYWCSWGKENKPHNSINELRIPGSDPPEYTYKTEEMSSIAASHYNVVQHKDISPHCDSRESLISDSLTRIHNCIPSDTSKNLAKPLSQDDIMHALSQSPNGKAPGLNGIPTELYKKLFTRWKKREHDDQGLHIIKLLTLLANNIEKHGTTCPQISEGWLCPLYKKKDRREIVNYRPITVLNAEYKIITTTLMNKLSLIAPLLVHKCQAAFIKGRSIFNQIDLVNRMTDLCEIISQDGTVIALDQEKAYDRIQHDYLVKND